MSNDNQKPLSRDEILGMEDAVIEEHVVPQWHGRKLFVRSINAQERGEIEVGMAKYKESKGRDDKGIREFHINFVFLGACDETGKRLFEKRDDIAALQKKNAAAISGIAEHVQRLSGFSRKDIEEMEKKSGEAQPEGLASVSP